MIDTSIIESPRRAPSPQVYAGLPRRRMFPTPTISGDRPLSTPATACTIPRLNPMTKPAPLTPCLTPCAAQPAPT